VYYALSESVEIDYILNLQLGDMDYSDLRRLEMSWVKIGNIVQRVFPNTPAAKIFEMSNKIISEMRQVQIAIRNTQRALSAYKAAKLAGAAFDPLLAISAGIDIVSAGVTTYEATVGTY
jgi:hypothetical protein